MRVLSELFVSAGERGLFMSGRKEKPRGEILSRREFFRKTARLATGAVLGTCTGFTIFKSWPEARVWQIDHPVGEIDNSFAETGRISLHGTTYTGITSSPQSRLYVAGMNALRVYEDYSLQKHVRLEGEATSIACDGDGTLFIGMTDHVEVYDGEGEQKDIWVSLGDNAFISSVAVSMNTVYLADAGNRLVMAFSKRGQLQTIIGTHDRNRGSSGFVIPSPYFDVAVGRDQSLWAGNTGLKKLENFTPEGTLLKAWGTSSNSAEGFCGCCNPSHFALLPDGSFVTSEKGIPRVKLYDPN
jgi:hypothetical protein